MMEVKADGLEASFDQVDVAADVAALRGEVESLRGRLDGALVAAGRPALAGAKGDQGGEAKVFVDRYRERASRPGSS